MTAARWPRLAAAVAVGLIVGTGASTARADDAKPPTPPNGAAAPGGAGAVPVDPGAKKAGASSSTAVAKADDPPAPSPAPSPTPDPSPTPAPTPAPENPPGSGAGMSSPSGSTATPPADGSSAGTTTAPGASAPGTAPANGAGGTAPADAAPSAAPAAGVRPRPPPPPPPQVGITNWDRFYKSRVVCLPPAPPPPDPFEPRPLDFRIDRLVSEDGRLLEVRQVPQWVDVLPRREIEDWRPKSIGDLLRNNPNVMIGDGGSPFMALPIIRGLGGDRVKVTTDGVWPATQAFGVAGATLSLWDPESTDHVEVYHGPGAYLRGADAGGGIVNIVPLRPHRHDGIGDGWWTASTAYQSGDNAFRDRLAADFGQGRWAALTGVTYEHHEDRDTASGTLDPSEYHWWAADAAVDYFLDNQSTVGFTGQYVHASDIQSPLGGGGLLTQPDYERLFLGLTLSSTDIGPYFHGVRQSISFDSFLQDDDTQTQLGLVNGISSSEKVKRFDYHLAGNLYLLDCHETWAELAVAYAHLERTESILCLNLPHPATVAAVHALDLFPNAVPGACVNGSSTFVANEWRVSGLLEDEWHPGCWDIHLGVRVDWHYLDDDRTGQTIDDFRVGVAGGVARRLSDCLSLFANASYGSRFPTVDELYSVAILDGVTVFGNPNLGDETSFQVETGFKFSRGDYYSAQAAVFVHDIQDFIGRVPIGLGTDQEWDNVGNVTMYGAELTGAWRPWPCRCEGLELFGMAGSTGTSDDHVVPDVPVHGRLGARYSNCIGENCGLRRWFVEGAARGAVASGFDGDNSSFVTTELLAGMGWSRGGRRDVWLRVGATNLFDEKYTEPFTRLPAMGRSAFASIQVDF